MRIRRALLGVAAAAALVTGAAVPAQAATSAAVPPTVTLRDTPPAGYVYIDHYFWHSSCVETGDAGMNKAWTAYVCINGSGSPFDDYELWVKPK